MIEAWQVSPVAVDHSWAWWWRSGGWMLALWNRAAPVLLPRPILPTAKNEFSLTQTGSPYLSFSQTSGDDCTWDTANTAVESATDRVTYLMRMRFTASSPASTWTDFFKVGSLDLGFQHDNTTARTIYGYINGSFSQQSAAIPANTWTWLTVRWTAGGNVRYQRFNDAAVSQDTKQSAATVSGPITWAAGGMILNEYNGLTSVRTDFDVSWLGGVSMDLTDAQLRRVILDPYGIVRYQPRTLTALVPSERQRPKILVKGP